MHNPAICLCKSVPMKLAGHNCDLRINRVGRVRCEPGWHLGRGWAQGLNDYDLWFVWEGRGSMQLTGDELALRPGVCVWMRPGRRYEAEQDLTERLGVNFIHFTLLQPGSDLPLSGFEPPFEALHTRQLGLVDALMRRIIDLNGQPDASEAAAALLGGLLAGLVHEQAGAGARKPPGTDQRHREAILRLTARIRESPAQVPSVAELARGAGYSVDYFSRLFLKVTGQRPQAFIIQAKLERAQLLLAESDLTVGMIAEVLGFDDIFYFSRLFRQKTGQPPTEFRRGLRQP